MPCSDGAPAPPTGVRSPPRRWTPALPAALRRIGGGCLAAVVVCAAAQPAEEEELALAYGDRATVSIATGSPQPLRRAPAVASVITAADIRAMGAVDLAQVLESVPGLHVTREANLYAPAYVIRGIYGFLNPHVLMLVNGVPVTTLLRGNRGQFPDDAPLANIERIEIIRGPGSALYGADAFAGVINLVTKTAAAAPVGEVGVTAGSFGTRRAWWRHGGRLGPFEVAAFVGAAVTDGTRRTIERDAQSRNDAAFGTRVSLAPGPLNDDRNDIDAGIDVAVASWRLRAAYKRQDAGTAAGVAQALDPVGRGRFERSSADLSWTARQLARGWSAQAMLAYLEYTQRISPALVLFPPGTRFPTGSFPAGMIGAPETWERHWRLSAHADYAGFAGHDIRLGAGHDDLYMYRTRELKNFTFAPNGLPIPTPGAAVIDFTAIAPFLLPHRRRVSYVYAQDQWQLARDWALTAGVRRDLYSDAGSTTNPRFALVWDAAYNLTAKLMHGSAFRAPAFTELYSINNPVARGNPALKPERIRTTEAVVAWHGRGVELAASAYRHHLRDILLAMPNPIPGTGSTWQNRGERRGHGFELEASWDATRALRLSGHYAWQRTTDRASGADAGYAPHHLLYLRGDWRLKRGWLASAQARSVSGRRRAAGDTRPPVADHATLDIALRSDRGAAAINVAAAVRNVFDADVREPSLAPGVIPNDLPQAGRAFYVQVTVGF